MAQAYRKHKGLLLKIADLQGASINTVLSRFRYGLDRLRSIMSSQNER